MNKPKGLLYYVKPEGWGLDKELYKWLWHKNKSISGGKIDNGGITKNR